MQWRCTAHTPLPHIDFKLICEQMLAARFCQRSLRRSDKANSHAQKVSLFLRGVWKFMNMTAYDVHNVSWMCATPAWARAVGKEARRRCLCPTGNKLTKTERRSGRKRRTKGGHSSRKRSMFHTTMHYNLDSFLDRTYYLYWTMLPVSLHKISTLPLL